MAAGVEPLRLKATDLATYLLYEADGEFLADGGGSLTSAADPSPEAEWRALDTDAGIEFRNLATDRPLTDAGSLGIGSPGQGSDATTCLLPPQSTGCAEYPEAQLNATGKPLRGSTPYTEAVRLADMHNHVSAFEFLGGSAHCGKPWDRYGIEFALVDCPDHYPNGSSAPSSRTSSTAIRPARTTLSGGPPFADWPDVRLAHPRADVLPLARARLARRRAPDGQQPRRERLPLPRLPAQAQLRATR